jgi:hypothetical protein
MSESDLGKSAPDLAEQRREAWEEPDDPEAPVSSQVDDLPLDVNEADAVEQHQEVGLDDEDYR